MALRARCHSKPPLIALKLTPEQIIQSATAIALEVPAVRQEVTSITESVEKGLKEAAEQFDIPSGKATAIEVRDQLIGVHRSGAYLRSVRLAIVNSSSRRRWRAGSVALIPASPATANR